MSERETIRIRLYLAWWFDLYLYGLMCMVYLTGHEPNWERVEYWVGRAVRCKQIKD